MLGNILKLLREEGIEFGFMFLKILIYFNENRIDTPKNTPKIVGCEFFIHQKITYAQTLKAAYNRTCFQYLFQSGHLLIRLLFPSRVPQAPVFPWC